MDKHHNEQHLRQHIHRKNPRFSSRYPRAIQNHSIRQSQQPSPAVEDKDGEYYIYTVIPEFTTIMFLLILMLSTTVIFIAKKSPKARDKIKTFQYAHKSIKPINIITSFVVQQV